MKSTVVTHRTWLALGTLLLVLSVHANSEHVTPSELLALKDQQQLQVDALKELQQAQAESVRTQIAAVDKRVDDLNTHVGQGVDRLGVYSTLMGILITVLLAGLGLLGFITVTRRTKAEAQDAAKAWFEDKTTALEKRLQDIESKASLTRQKMDSTAQAVLDHGEAVKKQHNDALEQALKDMQANMAQGASGATLSINSAQAVAVVQERAEELKKTPEDSYSFSDWNTRAHAAFAAQRWEEAALFWQKASQVFNAGVLNVAKALFNRGFTQGQLGQSEAEVATYDELLSRFSQASEPVLRELVAKTMVNKGVTQGQLGQSEAAIVTYDELVSRFGQASELALREQVAKAMLYKGVTQSQLGQSEAEMATYDELVSRFDQASEPALREQVAKAIFNKGVAQRQLGQDEAAMATYDALVSRFGQAGELALRELVAKAIFNKGVAQGQLGQDEAAMATYDELVSRFDQASELALREQVAWGMLNKGVTQGQLGQSEAAMATYDELVSRFGQASELALRELVAKAIFNKGVAQGQLGQDEAAMATYDELVSRFGQASELALREQVAKAIFNKGIAQRQLGQDEAAMATYDELVSRFGQTSEPALRELVAKAIFNKGIAQSQLGHDEAAMASYDELLSRFGQASELALRELMAKAMVNKAVIQRQLGHSEAAMASYDELLSRFGQANEPALREQVANAHNGIGFARMCEGKALWSVDAVRAKTLWQKALGHLDQALAKLDAANMDGSIMGNRAYALALLGDTQQAEALFAQAMRAPVSGGKSLYDGTLSDFDIHPIPLDEPMRELVERQWRIWQAEQGGGYAPPSAP